MPSTNLMLGRMVHPFFSNCTFHLFLCHFDIGNLCLLSHLQFLHFNNTTISKHNGWNKNKFLVMVIRILKIQVNMYLKLFTRQCMLELYACTCMRLSVGIGQGWVTAPWEFRQWTEDRSRCASSLCVIVVHWFALLCTKDCCCRTSFILWTVVARWLYVVVLHHLVNNPADESTLRAVIEWI